MQYILHDLYRKGNSGFSNLVMSTELGIVLAALTGRVLVLRSNISPPGNVVRYGAKVTNAYPSRVTDLMDLGVPWVNADRIGIDQFAPHDICDRPAWDCVFRYPESLSTDSEDIRAFAGIRRYFVNAGEDLADLPMLWFSGGPLHDTLSFYSYFFYLDQSSTKRALLALSKTRAKPEYAAFAEEIVKTLGDFNAVHIRRGDFKKTTGVTTLIRTPEETIEALDCHFTRDDLLVILTDEADDPYFAPIKAAFSNHLLIDHHILDAYASEFLDLPAHDSVALAYLSQLVAARSQDFIGTMTSTFTSMIQRARLKSGLNENFKFLWNEIPDTDAQSKPGSHPRGTQIPMHKGTMVPVRNGIYSWNRYDQRINPAWMREWPECAIDEKANLIRNRACRISNPVPDLQTEMTEKKYEIAFKNHTIGVRTADEPTLRGIRQLFRLLRAGKGSNKSDELRVEVSQHKTIISLAGRQLEQVANGPGQMRSIYRHIVCQFMERFPELFWLHAGAVADDRGAIVLPGEWARGKSSLVVEFSKRGFLYLSDDVAPIDSENGTVLPFSTTPQVRVRIGGSRTRKEVTGAKKRAVPVKSLSPAKSPQPVGRIVFPLFTSGAAPELTPVSPGQAAAKLIESCLSFVYNEDAVVHRLCNLVARLPLYELRYENAQEAADLVIRTFDLDQGLPRKTIGERVR